MRAFRYKIFPLVVIFLVIVGCQRDLYRLSYEFSIPEVSKEPPLIEFIFDPQNHDILEEHKNLRKVAEYTKIPYQSIPMGTFNTNFKIAPTTRVICVAETFDLNDKAIDSLLGFVAKGGTLFLTKKNYDQRIGFLMGFRAEANYKLDSSAYGIHFKKPIFPNMKDFTLESDKTPHKGFKAENFSGDVNILATSADDKEYPLIVENRIGKGKVVLYNSTRKFYKAWRGLMFANTLIGLEGIPYPIANTSTIFLDDFPSPLYNIYKEPIQSEMNKTIAEYVTDVWWPDMKELAREENIQYTAYVTFDYNAQTTPPFTFKEWDINTFTRSNKEVEKSSWLGKDVQNSGHELGFHGYNHVSLLKSEWLEPVYINTAISTAIKKWKILDFKELPISYVPPSNYIDSLGLAKLQEGMPSIKYIQSNYLGNFDEGGYREFDPEPYNDHFFNYPRISSGYFLEKKEIMTIESLYLFTGIWTHFVHPDDVYQIPDKSNAKTSGDFEYRNKYGLNWYFKNNKKGLLDTFRQHLKDFRNRHPMVRYLNATKSSDIVRDWRYFYYTHIRENGNYLVETDYKSNSSEKLYWFLYVSSENEKIIDKALTAELVEYKKSPILNGNLYSIATEEGFLKLPDLKYKGKGANKSNNESVAQAFSDFKQYENDRVNLLPLMQLVNHFVSNGNLSYATDLLEKRIIEGVSLSKDQWGDYAKYLVWQKRGWEIWDFLEDIYKRNESQELADISRTISYQTAYPNEETREKWLTRQINWGTENTEVLNEYMGYFNTADRKDQVSKVLRKLLEFNPGPTNNKKYLNHLISNDFNNVVEELNKLHPCDEDYKEMATTIAWAYADRLRYDKAMEWQKCSKDIVQETINDWLIKLESYEELKQTDYSFYLDFLLANDEKKALEEIHKYNACDKTLVSKSATIAYAYANIGLYREAIAWSKCTTSIPFTSKMTWLYELKEYQELRQLYDTYIANNPEDYEAKLLMGTLLLYKGDIKTSAQIAASLPADIQDGELKTQLNKEIMFLSIADKQEMLGKYKNILYSGVRRDIYKSIRMDEGNSVSTSSYIINDKLEPNTLSNIISYNIYDEKFNVHSFSGTQSIMYPLNFNLPNPDNIRRDLFGFEYRFKRASSKKLRINGRARIERDNIRNVYYQIGAGVGFISEKSFNSIAMGLFPVRNGPGHVLDIYRTQTESYNEFKITDNLKQIIAFESNYYSDKELDALLLGRMEYSVLKMSDFKLSPLIEGAYSAGTIDRRNGFPYWMADKRLYGGGGISLALGQEKSGFYMVADASIFSENNNTTFERYTGSLAFRIKDFTTIKAGYEFYTIENFYSNVFQLGMTYNFR